MNGKKGSGGKRIYEFLMYETTDAGITTITLNRPPMNAFNCKMRRELINALQAFKCAKKEGKDDSKDDSKGERVLILTGAGEYFSTGEDLQNIHLDANDMEMSTYALDTLEQYHDIIRAILLTGKPIIAALNGMTAGAGLSIALACDYRMIPYSPKQYMGIVPAFATMGLIADSGMTATLPRLLNSREAKKWLEEPGLSVSLIDAYSMGLIDMCGYTSRKEFLNQAKNFIEKQELTSCSEVAYAFSKERRNSALIHELNKHVFPWEIRAQTACLESEYFKQKAREILAKKN